MSKALFNIPVGGSGTSIQFGTDISHISGLQTALDSKLSFSDTSVFDSDSKFLLSCFPDTFIGQSVYGGKCYHLVYSDHIDTEKVRIAGNEDAKKLIIEGFRRKGRNDFISAFEKSVANDTCYLYNSSNKDGETIYDDSAPYFYLGYSDCPSFFFLIDGSYAQSGELANGFCGAKWAADDWCVPASGGSQITSLDVVTSVNGQIGNVSTYGGFLSQINDFYAGNFYYNDTYDWYAEITTTTTIYNEPISTKDSLLICTKSFTKSNVTLTKDTVDSSRASLGEGTITPTSNLREYFFAAAGGDLTLAKSFWVPDIPSGSGSNNFQTVRQGFLNGTARLNNVVDNALINSYTQEFSVASQPKDEPTITLRGPGRGIAVVATVIGGVDSKGNPAPEESQVPNINQSSTASGYKFYIQFTEEINPIE